jgi:DNA processing protein
VEKRGALISEFPLGTHPAPENFPIRNRVVAGMSLGVLVVQGAQYSGSLITARLGMEFGREVYGVPGNVTVDVSFAPNQMIKQGAKLVTSWEDVIEELPTEIRAELFPVQATTQAERASLFEGTLSAVEKKIFALLGTDETIHVDELVEKTELNSSEVLAALCEMEMKGMVRQMPGKQFLKILL